MPVRLGACHSLTLDLVQVDILEDTSIQRGGLSSDVETQVRFTATLQCLRGEFLNVESQEELFSLARYHSLPSKFAVVLPLPS